MTLTSHHGAPAWTRPADGLPEHAELIPWIDGIVWEANPQTFAFTFVSSQAQRMLGYSPSRWLDTADFWVDHIHPDDRELALSRRRSACDELRNFRCDYRMRAADGHYVWLQDVVSVVGNEGRPAALRGIMLDITERKALEVALRRSESLLSAIYTSGDVGVFVADVLADGSYCYLGISPVHERLMGISNALVEGKAPEDLIPHLGKPAMDYALALYAQCIRERVPIESEFLVPDGPAQGWWLSRLTPVFDERVGRVVRLIGTALPITSRKLAEAAVRESEERLRLAVHASNVGLWDWDVRTQRVRYSREWKAQLGYEDDELEDDFREWEARVHPDDLAPTLASVQFTLAHPDRAHEVEFRMRHKDGSWRWIYTRAAVLCDNEGSPVRFLGGHVDITARKEAEEQIRRLATFPEQNPNPVFELSADGTLTYHNAAADGIASALGFAHAAELLPPDTSGIVRDCIQSGRPRLRHQTQHGTATLSWSFYPVPVDRGASGGVHAYAIDISDRLRLEEQLRHSQKMDAIGQLAGGIAHDFNNLLTVIQGNISLLNESDGEPQLRAEALAQVTQAVERATGLTRQLLTVSRKQCMQSRPTDINEVVRNLIGMLERIVSADVHLKLDLHPGPLVAPADAGMLDQVLINLTNNARDAMPNGGTLTFETREIEVHDVDLERHPDVTPGHYIRLSVADVGCGIASHHLPHVFEPFFTTKEVGEGTGLGLATVFGIIKQHNGSIYVDSAPGRGTRFEMLLPVLKGTSVPDSVRPPHLAKPRGGEESILVVEDEAPLRQLLQRLLEMAGYRVLCAESGVAALSLCEQRGHEIDLVLTDVIMPGGVSGYDLAARLRERRPSQRIVYMSGYTGDSVVQAGRLRAGHNFLQKPFTAATLLGCVRAELDGMLERV